MKNIIYIADLNVDNARLMPWRVPLEVVKHWPGDDVPEIWSGGDWQVAEDLVTVSGVPIRFVPRIRGDLKGLSLLLRGQRAVTLYFPVAFSRSYSNAAEIEKETGCRIVWYLPGGWFSFRQCFAALRYMPCRRVLPYLVQALYPKRRFFRSLRAGRLRSLVNFSDYSSLRAARFYPERALFTAPPGMDKSVRTTASDTQGGSYLLFFGPPNAIRGAEVLLRAFEHAANKLPQEIRLHLCIRADGNADAEPLRKRVAASPVAGRIDCRWDSLTREEVEGELDGCLAVVKPFLIVPSEIPLAVIESAACGRPVLCSGPDGTGDFASRFGLVSRHGNWRELAKNIERIATDAELRKRLMKQAVETAENAVDWDACAAIWKKAGEMPL